VFVALGIQHAKRRMRRVILPFVAFLDYFINGTIFGNKLSENKMCFDFLYKFCPKYFSI
jgi:hypothetical protein